MVAINRKNDLMEAMLRWVIKENQAEINNPNGVNLGTLFFYIISSNPKKWIGEYGRAGYHGSADGKVLVRDKGEERIAARILNFPGDRLVHRVYSHAQEVDAYNVYIYIFDGDWVKVCPGLYYSKELDNYYWTGDRFDGNTWHGSEWSERIKAYIADYSNSYYSTSHFWDWCEEHFPLEPEEVDTEGMIKNFCATLHNAIIDLLNPECDGEIFWEDRKIGDFKDGQGYFYTDDFDDLRVMVESLADGVTCRLEDGRIVFREGWIVE